MKKADLSHLNNKIIKILFFCELKTKSYQGLTFEELAKVTNSYDDYLRRELRTELHDAAQSTDIHSTKYSNEQRYRLDWAYDEQMRALIEEKIIEAVSSKKDEILLIQDLTDFLMGVFQMNYGKDKNGVIRQTYYRARNKMWGMIVNCKSLHKSGQNKWVSKSPIPIGWDPENNSLQNKMKGEGTLEEVMSAAGVVNYQNKSVRVSEYPVSAFILSQDERIQIEAKALSNMDPARAMRYRLIQQVTKMLNNLFRSGIRAFETDHAKTICQHKEAAINPDNIQVLNAHLNRKKGAKSTPRMTFHEQAKHIRNVVKDLSSDISMVCDHEEYVETCIGMLEGIYRSRKK